MIIPDIIKDKWKPQPTTVELLKVDLQTTRTQLETTRTDLEQALEAEKEKTKNLESRLAFLETAVASLIS